MGFRPERYAKVWAVEPKSDTKTVAKIKAAIGQ